MTLLLTHTVAHSTRPSYRPKINHQPLKNVQFLTTFTQLTARLKNFLRGWLVALGIKEGLVECATVCVKSEVILKFMYGQLSH